MNGVERDTAHLNVEKYWPRARISLESGMISRKKSPFDRRRALSLSKRQDAQKKEFTQIVRFTRRASARRAVFDLQPVHF